MTTGRPSFGLRADDPGHRLRLEFSGGVEWRPILRTALGLWVPAPLRARIADIEAAIVELAAGAAAFAVELRQDGDDLVTTVGGLGEVPDGVPGPGAIRRWQPPT